MEVVRALRNVSVLEQQAILFADLLVAILKGETLKTNVAEIASKLDFDLDQSIANDDPMAACHIDKAFKALLHFAYKYE